MDLYALPPEEFTAARDAAAKQARTEGDKEAATALAALRRPTASAHAVNALVRAEPDLVEQLLGLGGQLAQAQAEGQGAALRALGEQRRALVEAVADRAGAVAGRPLTAAVRAEVVATLEAALADPASGEAVRSGRLVRALSYAGFGGVDLEGAVAPPTGSPGPTPRTAPRKGRRGADEQAAAEREARRRAVEEAEQAALAAAGALDDAVRQGQAAGARAAEAAQRRDEAQAAVAAAEQALLEARHARDEAVQVARRAEHDAERAQVAVAPAQAAAEAARAALDRLRRADA